MRQVHRNGLLVLATTTMMTLSSLSAVVEARTPIGGAAFAVPATLLRRAKQQQRCQEQAFSSSVEQQQCVSRSQWLPQHFLTNLPLDELASSSIDDDDDSSDNLKESADNSEEEYSAPSGFYDVDHVDDEEEDGFSDHEGVTFTDFDRDEDDILTEREDRFYVDERGHRRVVEKCILVGVENLSAKRKLHKQQRMNNNDNFNEYDNKNPHVEEEDMQFTLEESLAEMRELIKTAGMECSAGKWLGRIGVLAPAHNNVLEKVT